MVKYVPRILLLLLALLMLAVSAAMFWVSHTPRDVSHLIPQVEESLNPDNAPIHVTIGEAHIDWRRWEDFGKIAVTNVRIISNDGTEFAVLPHIQVRLSPLGFITGDIGVDWIIIPHSDLELTSTPDRKLMLGFGSSRNAIPLTSLYQGDTEGDADATPLRLPFNHLVLEDADIAIRDPSGKLLLRTYKSELSFSRENYGFQGAFRLNFNYRNQRGSTQSLVRYYQRDQSFTVASKLVNVPIGLICGIAGDCGPMSGLRGAVTGRAAANVHNAVISDADVMLSGARLKFTAPEWFAEPLEFDTAAIDATVADNMKRIDVETVDLKNSEVRIVASGKAQRKEEGWKLDLVAKQNNLNLKNLYKYWPVGLASDTRTWVTDSINQGISPEAIAMVALEPKDFKAELFPDRFLRATVQVKNATVKYLPRIAPVKGLDGTVHFTGTTMRADVGGGNLFADSKLTQAKVFVPDLNHPNVPMHAELTLDTAASDVASLFKHPAFTFDDALKLNESSLQGRLTGKAILDFDAFSGKAADSNSFDVSGVGYDIDVDLANIGQKALMGAYDVSGFNGHLQANAKGFSLAGKGNMNATPLEVDVAQEAGKEVHVAAKGAMTRNNLVALGMPDRKEIGDGTIGFDAGFMVGKDTATLDSATIDLTNVALTVPDISWQKPKSVASTLSLKPVPGGAYSISHSGGGLAVKGQLELDSKTQAVKRLALSQVKSAGNDFAIDYQAQGDAMRVKLTGGRFDNSMAYTSESDPQGENALLANFPKLYLTLDLQELVLAPNAPFRHIKGTLDCAAGPCISANIASGIGEKGTLTAAITNNGNRTIEIKADDAGALLRAIDMTDKMNRGKLEFKGTYLGESLKGKLIITDFNVKQSQVLARLFSVASLSGLANLLTGSGIDFEKLRADVTHQKGIFTVQDARANGASTGYTAEGTIDTRNATLNLKGVLVPAYAVNSILGKIPLIGAIAGGEGEGLISFNYRIKGKYTDPDVSVNPLSGLTPGFLRGIFDGESTLPEDAKATPKKSANGEKTPGPATPIRPRR